MNFGSDNSAGFCPEMLEALAREGINVRMVSTSAIRLSVLVDEARVEDGVRSLHQAFELHEEPQAVAAKEGAA